MAANDSRDIWQNPVSGTNAVAVADVSSDEADFEMCEFLYKSVPRQPLSPGFTEMLNLFTQLRSHCNYLKEYGKEDEVDKFVDSWYSTSLGNKSHDLSVLALIQKSSTLLYRGDIKGSLKYVKQADIMVEEEEMVHSGYLNILISVTLLSRYKAMNKLGKAQQYLDRAKYHCHDMDPGECTGLVLWAEGGYHRSMLERLGHHEHLSYDMWYHAVECYLDAIDQRHYMPDTELVLKKEQAMKLFTKFIKIKLKLFEDTVGHNGHLITMEDLDVAERCTEMLEQLYSRFSVKFLKADSVDCAFYTCHMRLLWCGFYMRRAQFFMSRGDQESEANVALARCYSYGFSAHCLASSRNFTEEKEEAERFLASAHNLSDHEQVVVPIDKSMPDNVSDSDVL